MTNTAVLSVSGNGALNWLTPVSIENASSSSGFHLDTDGSNNIYAMSQIMIQEAGSNKQRSLVTKLSPSGTMEFEKVYGDTGHNITPYKIYTLPEDKFSIIVGNLHSNSQNKVAIVQYDFEGHELNVEQTGFYMFYRDSYRDDLGSIYTLLQVQDNDPFPFKDFFSTWDYYIYGAIFKTDIENHSQLLEFQSPERSIYYSNFLIPHHDGRLVVSGGMTTGLSPYMGIYFFESEYEFLSTADFLNAERDNWLGQNYPNPVKGVTSIPFKIKESNDVSIILYNSVGKYVKTVTKVYYPSGEHTATVNLSELPKGVYFYQLSSGNFKSSKKLIVK